MPNDIPGWYDWQDLYDRMLSEAEDGAYFVETGTFFGKSAHHLATNILASGKRITFDTWDNWSGVPPGFGYPGWLGPEDFSEQLTRRILANLPVNVYTGDAILAAQGYPDAGLDFVFLDDHHGAEHVQNECTAWWPKIKPGGVLAGHDYDWPSVFAGVARWAREAGTRVEAVSARCWLVRKPKVDLG